RLTSIIRAQVSGVIRSNGSMPNRPALVTKIPTGPSSLRARLNPSSTAARSVTSTVRPSAFPPPATTESHTCCAASLLTSITATEWPRRASSWQVAAPMPEPPPVTTATRDIARGLLLVDDPDRPTGRKGLTGQYPTFSDLVFGQRLVVQHASTALEDAGH